MKINLTEREIQILKLIAQGYDSYQIGEKIHISGHTVKAHICSILRKLESKTRAQAIYNAMINGIIN